MGVIDELKEIGDLIKKVGDIELYRRIVNLEGEIIDLTRDKRHLGEKVQELQRALEFKDRLVFRNSFYWMEGDHEPYCPGCWEAKKLAIHTSTVPEFLGLRQCPVCKHTYGA